MAVAASFVLTLAVMFEISPALNSLLEFAPFPSAQFRMELVKIILADMAVTVAVESAVHLLLYKVRFLTISCLQFDFVWSFFCFVFVTYEMQRACASKSDKL